MGNVKIRYYVTHQHPGRPRYGFWSPCLRRMNTKTGKIEPTLMAKLGFACVALGDDGPDAWALAERWNAKWDEALRAHREGRTLDGPSGPIYPACSMGEGFVAFKTTGEWRGKKKRTREDWERGWKHIAPIFGDVDPRTVSFQDVDHWYNGSEDGRIVGLLEGIGVREAHRAMKIWRALWRVVATFKNPKGDNYCDRDRDPSLGIRRKTPKPRTQVWYEGEIVRLVKAGWRMGYRGAAVALAVAWDTMLSPIDVVSLTAGQRGKTKNGPFQFLERAKTGAGVIGTIGRRTERLLGAYVAMLGFDLHPDTPIFHTRGGAPGPRGGRPRPPVPYKRDKLGKDFAEIRAAVFPGDRRQIIDFRRSGAVEAEAGQVDKKALGAKMGNTIETNTELQRTYLPRSGPQTAQLVQLADEARTRGRGQLRRENGSGS